MPDIIYFTPDCNCVGIFEQFYYDWNPTFFCHVITKVPDFDLDLAQEICQQVWTEVWQGVRAKTLPYLMPGLLCCRADSRIKDHYRRKARFQQFDPAQHGRSDVPDLDERIDYKIALAALPDDERMIVTLFFREGLTQEEIAARLAVTTRTVRRRMNTALENLREFLCGDTTESKSSKR
jgi:RNA polymerase sigma factor (sigma-70 family)